MRMELILSELQRNGVDIDMRTLSWNINECRGSCECMQSFPLDSLIMADIFNKMDVNNFGRAMSYLTLVWVLKDSRSEEEIRQAVGLVAPFLNSINMSFYRITGFLKNIIILNIKCISI